MCCCRIFLTVFVIFQFVAVALVTIGTPFDMYRPVNSEYTDNTPCITLWGSKDECFSSSYTVKAADLWRDCDDRRSRLKAASVCAIITIGAFFASFLLGLIQCCCCLCCKFLCAILNVVGVGVGVACFALVLDSWFNDRGPANFPMCNAIKESGEYKLGAGFGLLVAGVGVGFVNIFIAMLPC